jgi:hypothetical protein
MPPLETPGGDGMFADSDWKANTYETPEGAETGANSSRMRGTARDRIPVRVPVAAQVSGDALSRRLEIAKGTAQAMRDEASS